MLKFIISTFFVLIVALSGPAYAAPVEYTFTANWLLEVIVPLRGTTISDPPTNFFGPGDTVSGSFFYDSSTPVGSPLPPVPGLTRYTGAITNLSGSIGGNVFSDPTGVALVNDSVDIIGLLGDPGVNLGPLPTIRNFSGFTIDGFTLANVRLNWLDLINDVITDDSLPPVLPPPGFEMGIAQMQLAFVNGPLDSPNTLQHIVAFEPVTVEVVPEPSTIFLLGTGLAGLAGWRWRREKRNEGL